MCVCGRTCLHLVVVLELKLEMDLSRFFAYFPDQLAMFSPPPPNSYRKKRNRQTCRKSKCIFVSTAVAVVVVVVFLWLKS